MGFFFSLLYIALAILSPGEAVPTLAPYRIQLWLALAAVLTSLPAILEGRAFLVAQAGFLIAVIFGLVASFIWMGWFGGILPALTEFIPNAIVFYLVVVNFRTIKRLRWLTSVLVLISLYLVVRGAIAYVGGNPNDPMVLAQWNEDNTAWFPRMRAFGFLNDPNDLAQFLITIGPLLWLRWQFGRFRANVWRVLVPGSILLVGVFLTHSRGGIVALAAVLLFACKDRIGRTRSIILAVAAVIAMRVFNFTGGRDMSMGAGKDRIDAWSQGLEMFRSSPLFGVGYRQFVENYGLQAHNTFIHCAAELGFFGYFFWMALVVFSFSDLTALARQPSSERGYYSDEPTEPVSREPSGGVEGQTPETVENPPADSDQIEGGSKGDKLARWGTVLRISLLGYLTASFFLSRAYTVTLFVLSGMAAALRLIAISEGCFVQRQPSPRLYRLTAQISVASLMLVYAIVRIRWLR
jgi:O-antigen ligase